MAFRWRPYSMRCKAGLFTGRLLAPAAGSAWTLRTAVSGIWRDVAFGNGVFAAVSTDGTNRVMTSTTGESWTGRSASEQNEWQSVAFGGGRFVAVSSSGLSRAMTSTNGIDWTARNASSQRSWQKVVFGGGLFLAVDGAGNGMISSTGQFWSNRTTPFGVNASIAYGNGVFVSAGASSPFATTDGTSWTQGTYPSGSGTIRSIAFGGGSFVVATSLGFMVSTDGLSWAFYPGAQPSGAMAFGGGVFVLVSASVAATSNDGISWTSNSWSGGQLRAIAFGNGVFVGVGGFYDENSAIAPRAARSA